MENIQYTWWNLLPSHMNPTLVQIGSFPIRYYGLMYLAAFFTTFHLAWRLIQKEKLPISREHLENIIAWMIGGVLLGGRFGYVFFYKWSYYSQNPIEIIAPFSFEGGFRFTGISGMSYHGGLIGAIIAGTWYVYKYKLDLWLYNNLFFTVTPLGYTFGRIGNFINGELYGRVTNSPIGMLFPDGGPDLRHPSQLYEGFFEGIVLFCLLYFWARKSKLLGQHMMACYLFFHGMFRFFIEYFREPDAHLGLNALGFSRGQMLCFYMMTAGIILFIYRRTKLKTAS